MPAWGAESGEDNGFQTGEEFTLFAQIYGQYFLASEVEFLTTPPFQDTYVDFFVVSDASKIDRVEVGRKISDHCFCVCALSFCTSIGNARRVFDFRRTIQNPQSMQSLSAYFDAIDFVLAGVLYCGSLFRLWVWEGFCEI